MDSANKVISDEKARKRWRQEKRIGSPSVCRLSGLQACRTGYSSCNAGQRGWPTGTDWVRARVDGTADGGGASAREWERVFVVLG